MFQINGPDRHSSFNLLQSKVWETNTCNSSSNNSNSEVARIKGGMRSVVCFSIIVIVTASAKLLLAIVNSLEDTKWY